MKVVVGEILPLALVVTISPINVIPVILLLFTRRPLVNASCFLAGFIAGVAAVLVACVTIAEAIDLSPGSGHSTWVGTLKLVLGAYLLVAAVRKFRGRPRAGQEGTMPKWMDGIAEFSPGRSLGTGFVLGSLNPKNVAVGVAAAASIASVASAAWSADCSDLHLRLGRSSRGRRTDPDDRLPWRSIPTGPQRMEILAEAEQCHGDVGPVPDLRCRPHRPGDRIDLDLRRQRRAAAAWSRTPCRLQWRHTRSCA